MNLSQIQKLTQNTQLLSIQNVPNVSQELPANENSTDVALSRSKPILPPDFWEIILNMAFDIYVPIKSVHQLALFSMVDRNFCSIVRKIIDNNDIVKSQWNVDKNFFIKLKKHLKLEAEMKLRIPQNQLDWGHNSIGRIAGASRIWTTAQICYAIDYVFKKIQHINVSLDEMYPATTLLVLDALSKKIDITFLSLTLNGVVKTRSISQDDFIDKIILILNNKDLSDIYKLSLENNGISDNNMKKLAEALSGKNVFELSLANNGIGKAGARNLGSKLKNIKVTRLNLSHNMLDEKDLEYLLTRFPRKTQYLDLRFNYIEKLSKVKNQLKQSGIEVNFI